MTPGRPRLLRKALRFDRDGAGKVARDYRLEGVTLERVNARGDRLCGYHLCKRPIVAGSDYAVVSDPRSPGPFVQGRRIPGRRDFHPECVPPELRPLLRLVALVPLAYTEPEVSS